jgi:C-methyltransferase C-terminal domain
LAPDGVVTIEVPHLLRLVEDNQFDTIHHTLLTARKVLAAHGLQVFDVDELKSYGGSLRVYAQRRSTGRQLVGLKLEALLERERALGFDTLEGHSGFSSRVEETKWRLLEFLIQCRREGRRDVRSRFHPERGYAPLDDVLEQVAVVAGQLHHPAVRPELETSTAISTYARACSTQESEYEEK